MPDSKNYWLPDDSFSACFECGKKFSIINRRHHCRFCGRIFCQLCSSQARIIVDQNDVYDGIFLKNKVSLNNRRTSSPSNVDLNKSENQFQGLLRDVLSVVLNGSKFDLNSIFDVYQNLLAYSKITESDVKQNRSGGLNNIKNYFSQSRTFDNENPLYNDSCTRMSGSDIFTYVKHSLVDHTGQLPTDEEVMSLLNSFLRVGMLTKSSMNVTQTGFILSKPYPDAESMTKDGTNFFENVENTTYFLNTQPLWIQELKTQRHSSLSEMYQTNTNNIRLKSKTNFAVTESKDPLSCEPGDDPFKDGGEYVRRKLGTSLNRKSLYSQSSVDIEDQNTTKDINENETNRHRANHKKHLEDYCQEFIAQDLRNNYLSQDWHHIIFNLARDTVEMARIDMRNQYLISLLSTNRLDDEQQNINTVQANCTPTRVPLSTPKSIREFLEKPKFGPTSICKYIHIKKLVDNNPQGSQVLHGVCFTKKTCYKDSASLIKNPKILILACSLVYERDRKKFTHLDEHIKQEENYLRNSVGKITTLQPTMVLVQGFVSYYAQKLLHECGIICFYNLGQKTIYKIANATCTKVFDCVDMLSGDLGHLGTCEQFKLIKCLQKPGFPSKTLCLFLTTNYHDLPKDQNNIYFPSLTIILRGQSLSELYRVKRCLLFACELLQMIQGQVALCSDLSIIFPQHLHTSIVESNPATIFRHLNSSSTSSCETITRTEDQPPQSPQHDKFCGIKNYLIRSFGSLLRNNTETQENLLCCPSSIETTMLPYQKLTKLCPCQKNAIMNLKMPYLLTREGRHDPLFAYYQYLVDWPFSRILNDVLKKKLVFIASKTYANYKMMNQVNYKPLENHSEEEVTPEEPPEMTSDHDDIEAAKNDRQENTLKDVIFRGWSGLGRFFKQNQLAKSLANNPKETSDVQILLNDPEIPTVSILENRIHLTDLRNHTRTNFLQTVYSLESENFPEPCILPTEISISAWDYADISLGTFLEKNCFSNKPCPNEKCSLSIGDHFRRFSQSDASIIMRIITSQTANSTKTIYGHKKIACFLRCSTCTQATKPNQLSLESWNFSFVKFLDLLINSDWLNCQSLQRDETSVNPANKNEPLVKEEPSHPLDNVYGERLSCEHAKNKVLLEVCMNFGRKTVIFKYQPVNIYKLNTPIGTIPYTTTIDSHLKKLHRLKMSNSREMLNKSILTQDEVLPIYLVNEANEVMRIYYETFNGIKLKLSDLQERYEDCPIITSYLDNFSRTDDQNSSLSMRVDLLAYLINANELQGYTQNNLHLSTDNPEFYIERQLSGKLMTSFDTTDLQNIFEKLRQDYKEYLIQKLINDLIRWTSDSINNWNMRISDYLSSKKRTETSLKQKEKPEKAHDNRVSLFKMNPNDTTKENLKQPSHSSTNNILSSQNNINTPISLIKTTNPTTTEPIIIPVDETTGDVNLEKIKINSSSSGVGWDSPTSKTSSIGTPSFTFGQNRSQLILTKLLPAIFMPDNEHYSFRKIANPFSNEYHIRLPVNSGFPITFVTDVSSLNSPKTSDSPHHDQQEILKVVKSIAESESLFHERTLDVLVNENELTSIIAYAMTTCEYENLSKSYIERKNLPDASIEPSTVNKNIEINFSDEFTHFSCQIMYPVEFREFRSLVINHENNFIRSLARCSPYLATGGKSKSFFLRTKDNRFIIKQVSAIELKNFHEISLKYFDYMKKQTKAMNVSVLARIFGMYHIEFKNSLTKHSTNCDVLVMENLLFQKPNISHIYDLKGSRWKRLIIEKDIKNYEKAYEECQGNSKSSSTLINLGEGSVSNATGKAALKIRVLLDENFIMDSIENPIYLRFHSRNALQSSLKADTEFLARLLIMDYSLLLAIDPIEKTMTVGVIDYLRKFTADKLLEMFIKQSMTSAESPLPTIIAPTDYRDRFLANMSRYFPECPDHWSGSEVEYKEDWIVDEIIRTNNCQDDE